MGLGTGPGFAAGLGGIAGAIVVLVGLGLAAESWWRMRSTIEDPAKTTKKVLDSMRAQGLVPADVTGLDDIPAPTAGWIQALLQTVLALAKTASGYALAVMLIGVLLVVGSAWGTANSPGSSPAPSGATSTPEPSSSPSP